MSVWDGIDRGAFEGDLAALCRKDKYQDMSKFSGRLLPHLLCEAESEATPLPGVIERKLADDFAFLASWTTRPCHVAASAVQQKTDPNRLCVYIAANQGIEAPVQSAFEVILQVLQRRARRELSREQAKDLCQNAVVRLHRDRIFGRLGSTKTTGQRKSHVKIGDRFASLLREIRSKVQRLGPGHQFADLVEQLDRLECSIQAAQSSSCCSSEERFALESVLRAAFDIVTSRSSLLPQIKSLGVQTLSEQSREIRELQALGNYYRICKDLIKYSRQYRDCFKAIEVKAVREYAPEYRKGRKLFVHAEIQLLIHFELNPMDRPRFIGASKKPCFLCYCFIRAHASYSLCRSHGEVFLQWTVPDNNALSQQSHVKLSAALKQLDLDIKSAGNVKNNVKRGFRYLHPLQTVSKFFSDKSQTSLASTAATLSVVASDRRESLTVAVTTSPTEVFDEIKTKPASSSDSQETTVIDALGSEKETYARDPLKPTKYGRTHPFERTISKLHPIEFYSEGLELFFELEGNSQSATESKLGTEMGLCRIRAVSDPVFEQVKCIGVEELVANSTTIERTDCSRAVEFVLGVGNKLYGIELYWLNTITI